MYSKSYPSVCIPQTFTTAYWFNVRDIFERVLGKDSVERVDIVNKTNRNGHKYQTIFVHLTKWPENDKARTFRQSLIKGDDIKLVYDDPWFWKCYASNAPKPEWPPSAK